LEFLEEAERRDVRTLIAALMDLYYIILDLGAIVYEPTRILAKGYEVILPSNFVKCTLLVKGIANVLKEVWKAVYSPTRALIEELRISNTVEGMLDIPLTSRLLGQGLLLVASRKRKLTLESIENIFLKAFLKKLETDVEQLLAEIDSLTYEDTIYEEVFKAFTEDLKKKLAMIKEDVKRINQRTFMKYIRINERLLEDRALKRLAWKVLERNIYPYNVIASRALDYIRTNVLALMTKYEEETNNIRQAKLGLWDYKLYEVYTYYVVTYTFAKTFDARLISMWKDETLISLKSKEVKITYDKTPECKSWVSHGKYRVFNGNKISIPAGRPDIAVHVNDEITSVCDAKYRASAVEISQSRFKILGYMHEFDASIGVLIFDPGHVETDKTDHVDREIRETIGFIGTAKEHGGIVVEDANKILYIVALEPKLHTKLLESKEYRVLEDMVKKSIG